MAIRCQKCGRPNSEQSSKCIYCGTALPQARKEIPKEPEAGKQAEPKETERESREKFFLLISPAHQELEKKAIYGLARLMKWDPYTAKVRLRNPSPWVMRVSEELSRVQTMVNQLSELGIDVYLIKQSGLESLEKKALAFSAQLSGDQLIFRLEDDSQKAVSFGDLFLVVRGRIGLEGELKKKIARMELPQIDSERPTFFDRYIQRTRDKKLSQLEPGTLVRSEVRSEVEALDLYSRKDHQAVRVIESEFDFAPLLGGDFQPRLLGMVRLVELLKERVPDLIVDDSFIKVCYVYRQRPVGQNLPFYSAKGRKKSEQKLHSTQALFSEYSSIIYLHHLRQLSKRGGRP